VHEGTRTTAAYLDVVARIAASESDGNVDRAMMSIDELTANSTPFIIEFSGFGKRMNDTVIANVCTNPQAFRGGKAKYRGLRFDPDKFEIQTRTSDVRNTRYVTFNETAREAIMTEYGTLDASQQDSIQLFGCPAHVAAGVTRIYRTMVEMGFRNGLFEEVATSSNLTAAN
jgi:hypothetical protein